MVQGLYHIAARVPRPFAIALLTPIVIAASAAILLGLLGIFVLWLCIVAALVTAIVAADVTRRSLRRLAPTLIASFDRSAVGVPGR